MIILFRYYPRGTGPSAIRGDQITGNPRPPTYLSVKKTSASLANDAKDALAEVRRILNADGTTVAGVDGSCYVLYLAVLPYGWEEEYTEDGHKFYVKYVYELCCSIIQISVN